MSDALLVLNAGSSSLKFSVFLDDEPPRPWLHGQIDALLTAPRFKAYDGDTLITERQWPVRTRLGHQGAIDVLLEWARSGVLAGHRLVAAGHRIVHGGMRLVRPRLIDDVVMTEMESLIPLAPLHQPHAIAAVKAVAQLAPNLPQVACFDTAFHRTQPRVAQICGLPRRFADQGVLRFGFHGLSYQYVASVLPDVDARAAAGRTVIAHLGNGASMCALRGGRSVATTMGFSALDGLVMGTRCGAIDPGVLLYLLDSGGLTKRDLNRLLYEQSGLLGVSGLSSDMRELLSSANPHAAEAIDLFVYRIGRELGSLVSALGGLDALVFTGGIGEHAAAIRARVCRDAAWLGVELEDVANARGASRISRVGSPVSAWVVHADEEATIARHTQRVLEGMSPHMRDGTYEHS